MPSSSSRRRGAGGGGGVIKKRSKKGPRLGSVKLTKEDLLGQHMQVFKKGIRVWAENPYPEDAQTYRRNDEVYNQKVSGPPVWVPCVIKKVEGGGDEVQVETLWAPKMLFRAMTDSLFMLNEGNDVDDMVELSHLHEAALLHNVEKRFARGGKKMQQIYTMAGPILLVMNPYQVVTDPAGIQIYDPKYIRMYQNRIPKKTLDAMPAARREKMRLPPHVFAVADDTLVQLKTDREDQSVVISGESGAGKTECTKQIMQYLAACANPSKVPRRNSGSGKKRRGSLGSADNPFVSSNDASIEAKLLRTNPVLEALGNAKTVRNDNSSRFGKFIKIHVGNAGICGGSIQDYLLEKSRVVSQLEGERNYHVFYQMLAGFSADERAKFKLTKIEDYRYLNPVLQQKVVDVCRSKRRGGGRRGKSSAPIKITKTAGNMDDAKECGILKSALGVVGMSSEEVKTLFQCMSGVLNMGNISFEPSGENTVVTAATKNSLAIAASMIGVEPSKLGRQLTVRERSAGSGGKTIVSPLDVPQAYTGVDALSKALYGRVFKWVIARMNSALAEGADTSVNYIGILDIFGFEVFKLNSFEQFCINFANEKLQQLFTNFVFKLELQIYKEEQIDHSEVNFTDNQDIINLIEKKPRGLFSLLDEACLFPRSTDESFLQKCNQNHGKSNRAESAFYDSVRIGSAFVVKHSASDVIYTVDDFLEKNRDRLNDNILVLMSGSTVPLVKEIFAQKGESSARGTFTGSNAFLGAKFKNDINKLMATLRSTSPHFVRCIKPNAQKRTKYADPKLVLHQLRYLGVLDSIRIRHSGYSYRVIYSDFYEHFIIVAPLATPRLVICPPEGSNYRALCEDLFDALWKIGKFPKDVSRTFMCQFGLTKIFLRKKMIQALESLREVKLQDMDKAAVKIQARFRAHRARHAYLNLSDGFKRAQAAWRAVYYRRKWHTQRKSRQVVNRFVHMAVYRSRFLRIARSVRICQRFIREFSTRSEWFKARKGMRALHTLCRGYLIRCHVKNMMSKVYVIQRAARKFLAKNRIYWNKVRAALLMQALWRGHVLRSDRDDVVDFLKLKREERFKARSIRKVQSFWKAVLVQRRYIQICDATDVIQEWARSCALRARFKRIAAGTRLLQRVGRGLIARSNVRKMVTINMVADELWRVKTVREREELQLARINSRPPAIVHCSDVKVLQGIRRKGFVSQKLIDTDMMVDTFELYPNGWSMTVGDLGESLGIKGHRLEHVGVGVSHTVALDNQGKVYTWGWAERGQLGHGTFEPCTEPKAVSALEYKPPEGSHVCLPLDAGPPRDLAEKLMIKQIAVGDEHTLALSTQGQVYSWGAGGRGQLGCGDFLNHALPRLVSGLRRRVGDIACGAYHSVALVSMGSVYTWGSGAQLGLGVFTGNGDRCVPNPIKSLRKRRIRQINCGWGFTIVSTHAGNVFSWGENKCGQLGHGDTRPRFIPTLIDALVSDVKRSLRISQISCGARHSAAIGATGRVYTWGWNKHGQLGLGDTHDRLVPSMVSRLSKRTIKQVACGWRHTLALSSLNELWAWGHAGCAKPSDDSASSDKDVDRTQFEVLVPTEVPINFASSRIPLKVFTSFSHTVSCSGLSFQQRAAEMSTMASPLLLDASKSYYQNEADRMVHQTDDLVSAEKRGVAGEDDPANNSFTSPIRANAAKRRPEEGSRRSPSALEATPFQSRNNPNLHSTLEEKLDPVMLRTLDKNQLRILIDELVENGRHHGVLGGITHAQNRSPIHKGTGVRETGISRGRFLDYKTRAEHMTTFMHRGQGTTPLQRTQERGWNNQFTSRRSRARARHNSDFTTSPTYKSESRARTNMLKIQSGKLDDADEAQPTASDSIARPANRKLGERHSSVVLRDASLRGAKVVVPTEELTERAETQRNAEKQQWRQEREGNLGSSDIVGLFSSDLVLQCSEENVEDGKREEVYVPQEQTPTDSLSLYRKQARLMEEEEFTRLHSESDISQVNLAEKLEGPKWTGRRRSKVEMKRREIEKQYKGGPAANSAAGRAIASSLDLNSIRSSAVRESVPSRPKASTVSFGRDRGGSISEVLARIQKQAADDVAMLWKDDGHRKAPSSAKPPPPSRVRVESAADLASSYSKADRYGGNVQMPSLTRLLARARSVTGDSTSGAKY